MIELFTDITGYDLRSFLDSFVLFTGSNYNKIVSFYSGDSKEADSVSFNELNRLMLECDKIQSLVKDHKSRLSLDVDMWNLISELDDIKIRLMSVSRLDKWLHSVITVGSYNTSVEVEIPMQQDQTIEDIVHRMGDPLANDSWSELAMRNDLIEEDYTPDGGIILKAYFPISNGLVIEDVIDNPIGERAYGKDFNRIITFVQDVDGNWDLETLIPSDSIKQNMEVLVNLRKGDIPEYPDMGMNKLSTNIRGVAIPSLFRQIQSTVSTDDSVKSVAVKEVTRSGDSVFISVGINTKFNKEIIQEVF